MYQSDQINELATALAKAQSQLDSAAKSSTNPFHKNKYADISSIVSASRSALSSNGLSVCQIVIPHPSEANSNGMALVTQLMHSSGQWIKSVMPIILAKTDPQSLGAALTYYRRYAYSALVGVVTEEDDDGEKAMARDSSELITQEQVHFINNTLPLERTEGFMKYLNSIGYESIEKIKKKDFETLVAMIKKPVKS